MPGYPSDLTWALISVTRYALINTLTVKSLLPLFPIKRQRAPDGGKKGKGRKRHLATDTLGNMLAIQVHAANVADTSQGWEVCTSPAISLAPLEKRVRIHSRPTLPGHD